MSKTSIYFRNLYRKIRIENYFFSRIQLKAKLKQYYSLCLISKLQNLPYNSLVIRYKNRCSKTGRSRAYSRKFGFCRNILREFFYKGFYPEIKKANW